MGTGEIVGLDAPDPARRYISGVDYTACKTTSSSILRFQLSAGFFHCPNILTNPDKKETSLETSRNKQFLASRDVFLLASVYLFLCVDFL